MEKSVFLFRSGFHRVFAGLSAAGKESRAILESPVVKPVEVPVMVQDYRVGIIDQKVFVRAQKGADPFEKPPFTGGVGFVPRVLLSVFRFQSFEPALPELADAEKKFLFKIIQI